METDQDALTRLLDRWGVPFTLDKEVDRDGIASEVIVGDRGFAVSPVSDKVDGYPGFYTVFCFDAEGGFVRMGAWE